ncbi:hypothetical protein EG328_004442 [Venturia inaequalis]|uniref:Uncharacterized protein n=1 Tax=Venturia inaequalis TaxID=5025 RepID=A0A8H3UPG8_VENIN|nr:hypothetical protein EG328_004442 [Venturia inaequalis]
MITLQNVPSDLGLSLDPQSKFSPLSVTLAHTNLYNVWRFTAHPKVVWSSGMTSRCGTVIWRKLAFNSAPAWVRL